MSSTSKEPWPAPAEPVSGSATLSEAAAGSYVFSITCVSGSSSMSASQQVVVSAPVSGGGGDIDEISLAALLAILALCERRRHQCPERTKEIW